MQVNSPLITIITVVYNAASSLEETIQSVLKLSYPNIKYIIIDGGSTDGTTDVIKKYQNKIYYWVSEKDNGIYDAMNKGWAKAENNSYILFLGAGDRLKSLPDMNNHLQDDIIYGKVFIENWCVFDTKVDFRMRLVNSVHHQALLIKKNIHPEPPFSLDFPVFADFDFNQRLYKSGLPFIKDDIFYAFAKEGGVSSWFNKKEIYKVIKKNYGSLYVLLAKVYYFLQAKKNFVTEFKARMITNNA